MASGHGGSGALAGLKRSVILFVKSKIGLIGAVIIAFFILLAVLAPVITTYNPVTQFDVAAPYSIPAWATIFPQYANTSQTYYAVPAQPFTSASDLSPWQVDSIAGANLSQSLSPLSPSNASDAGGGSLYVNSTVPLNATTANSYTPNKNLPYGQLLYEISTPFQFNGKVPAAFTLQTSIDPLSLQNFSELYVVFIIQTPVRNYTLASISGYSLQQAITVTSTDQWTTVTVQSGVLGDSSNNLPAFTSSNPTSVIFTKAGTYNLTMQIQGACSDAVANSYGYVPCAQDPSLSALISPVSLHFTGGAFGLLGTDNLGRSVWSQFVWGSQISLLVGILAGFGSVGFGTLAGVLGGYLGGVTDEVLGRVTDFVLVLPFLPLLIILLFIIDRNPLFVGQVYFWVILIFVIISWPTVAKIIRSQVLSVKERSYVEASRALGSGTWHTLRKHILPNVMGLVYSQVALSVAGFILTEAALDFLSVSIHPITTITWGVMLTQSLSDATSSAIHSYVWWWFLPPGISIAALSLAFVLVGFALDAVFNPKLRAR